MEKKVKVLLTGNLQANSCLSQSVLETISNALNRCEISIVCCLDDVVQVGIS